MVIPASVRFGETWANSSKKTLREEEEGEAEKCHDPVYSTSDHVLPLPWTLCLAVFAAFIRIPIGNKRIEPCCR